MSEEQNAGGALQPVPTRPADKGTLAPGNDEGSPAPSSMLALIARAASDPAVDIQKMQALLDMHRALSADQALRQYNEAMNLAQAEIQPVARTAENTQTRSFYAKLEHVDREIRPIYLRHGFSVSRNTVAPLVPGNIRVEIIVAHNGGHVEKFYREAPPDVLGPKGTPTKTALHGAGSTETYLIRYATCGAFNVVFRAMDDDGNGGPLSDDQVAEIVDLIHRAKVGPKFLQYMKAQSVEEAGSLEAAVATIAARDYKKAISTLEDQLKKVVHNDAS